MATTTINRLTLMLGLIEAKAPDNLEYLHEWMDPNNPDEIHPDVVYAEGLACEELITSKGDVNWAAKREMEAQGFHVFAGEKDSFGWLTGCIKTKAGTLVYG